MRGKLTRSICHLATTTLTPIYRFAFVAILTIAMLIFDHRTAYFDEARYYVSNVNVPFYRVLDVPARAKNFFSNYWPNRKLIDHYDQLQLDHKFLQAKVQRYDALELEKNRLLLLLSANHARPEEMMMLARVTNTELKGKQDQRYVINRGRNAGVYISQAVIDANGVIGQVSFVAKAYSVVTLITDSSHAVPVEVLRNGLRTIVRGQGQHQNMVLPFLSLQSDIEVGDVLVTSGLGDVFPSGHPVAEVIEVNADSAEAFMTVRVRPFSQVDKVKEVLLLRANLPTTEAQSSSTIGDISDSSAQ